jgi:hypothetical protein
VDGFAWMANRWIDVPTPGGLQQMRLRRGFLTYRIKGQGWPLPAGDERADCIVTVDPQFPEELSSQQASAGGPAGRQQRRGSAACAMAAARRRLAGRAATLDSTPSTRPRARRFLRLPVPAAPRFASPSILATAALPLLRLGERQERSPGARTLVSG